MACAPPEPREDTGVSESAAPDPSVRFIYPPSGADIPLSSDCRLRLTVVVDIDHLELTNPDENDQPKKGQGHWHFETSLTYLSVHEEFVETPPLQIPPGTTQVFGASLQDNAHQPLNSPGSTAALEVNILQPTDGTSCP